MSAQEQEQAGAAPETQLVTPHDWELPWMGPFLEALARMPNVAAACRVVGIHRTRPYQLAREDPVFRAAWSEAVEIGIDLIERIAHQRATTGHEVEETRRVVERGLNDNGELIVVKEVTTTITRNEVSDSLMALMLRGLRPARWQPVERVEHHVGPADGLESVQAVGPDDDGIHRKPTPERARELARIALELEAGPPVNDSNGTAGDGT